MEPTSGPLQLSPLQLLEFAFDDVSIRSVPSFGGERQSSTLVTSPDNLRMRAESGIALLAEHDAYSDFGLKLLLHVEPRDADSAPYEANVSIMGTVRMHQMGDMKDADDRRKRALVNGVSILYGLVRDMVCNVTSRSSHGQMLLPTLNFSSLATQSLEVIEPPTAAPPPSKRRPGSRKRASA